MNREIPDNKRDNPIKYYMEKLAELDAQSIAARCALKNESSSVFLTILGTEYEIEIPSFERRLVNDAPGPDSIQQDGQTSRAVTDYLADKNTQVLVLHFLTESTLAPSSGRFISYREYPSGDLYFKAFDGRCLKRLAFSYGTKLDAFRRDCEALGAKEIGGADAAYEIEFMPGLVLQLRLWGPDEEFPPSAQILFSDNFPLAFSAEGVAGLGDILITALKRARK